jgi:hypothetical protein
LLTIFSIPKPFTGHIGVIQRNAIQSWVRLYPGCEVILCANEIGTQEIVDELKLGWIPDVECNEYGTPLLNSAFDKVAKIAQHALLCYVNADILLLPDFITAIQRVLFRPVLITGRRWNLELNQSIDFEQTNWQHYLQQLAFQKGVIATSAYLDYFVFPKDSELVHLPPFAVGRPTWDNGFVFRARQLDIPVVDITETVTVIHQNHDYKHIPGRRGKAWEGPEGDRNLQLIGGAKNIYTLADATHILTKKRLISSVFRWRYWLRLLQKNSPSWFPREKQIKWWFNVFKKRLQSWVQ